MVSRSRDDKACVRTLKDERARSGGLSLGMDVTRSAALERVIARARNDVAVAERVTMSNSRLHAGGGTREPFRATTGTQKTFLTRRLAQLLVLFGTAGLLFGVGSYVFHHWRTVYTLEVRFLPSEGWEEMLSDLTDDDCWLFRRHAMRRPMGGVAEFRCSRVWVWRSEP